MCQHRLRPSQCFVLIKQSDSPCPLQFLVSCFLRSETQHQGTEAPRHRPNPFHRYPSRSAATAPKHVAVVPSLTAVSRVKPPPPNPKSQSFSRSYGPNLPTSLTYIILSTRGCSPWRPDAVMSTTRGANKSLPQIFKDRH